MIWSEREEGGGEEDYFLEETFVGNQSLPGLSRPVVVVSVIFLLFGLGRKKFRRFAAKIDKTFPLNNSLLRGDFLSNNSFFKIQI